MLHQKRAIPLRVLILFALAVLMVGLPAAVRPAAAQAILNGPITPFPGSAVNGNMSLAADAQGNAVLTVRLSGLAPQGLADVNINAGTCSQPSASVLRLFTLTGDSNGQVTANAPVYTPQGTQMPLTELVDGNHVLMVLTDGRA
ncbi:MAG: hypothetical protein ACM30E_07130, partial [Nitrososphaerales archaeon]